MAEPSLVLQLSFGALLAAIENGTDARMTPSTLAELWPVVGLDFDKPVTMLRVSADGGPMLMRVSLLPNARLELGPAEEELTLRGLRPLKGGYCAIDASSRAPQHALCGPRPTLLALGNATVPSANLAPGAVGSLSFDFARGAARELDDARAEVPRAIDPLLPRAMQGSVETLRLLLADLSFELLLRQNEIWRTLGPLEVGATVGSPDKLALSARLSPSSSGLAQKSIAAARPLHVPAAFWELSPRTDGALVFDSSLLSELISPSARSLALSAEAKASGSLSDQVMALPSACLAPGRSVVWAVGHDQERAAPTPTWPPALEDRPAPPTAPSHALVAIEDEHGQCFKAVTALVDDYVRSRSVAKIAPDEQYLKSLPIAKSLPKSVRLFSVGWGDDTTYLAVATHKSATWFARAKDAAYLERTLADLLAPGPARKGLKSRSELSRLTTTGALVSGFWREDELAFNELTTTRSPLPFGAPPTDESKVRRVPLSLIRDGEGLRLGAELDVRATRRWVARQMGQLFGNRELAQLPAPQHAAALRVIDTACRLEDGAACNILGLVYGEARGVPKDTTTAVKYLERACALGSGLGCVNLPSFQKFSASEELDLFRKSCELQTPLGCAWLGARLLEQDKPDTRAGISKLQQGCAGFVGFACTHIAFYYAGGTGLPKDDEKAADFYERGCTIGSGLGCVGLAGALREGRGRERDVAKSLARLNDACRFDRAEGCYALGLAYLQGQGAAKDVSAAKQHLGAACDAEQAEACRVLAEISEEP